LSHYKLGTTYVHRLPSSPRSQAGKCLRRQLIETSIMFETTRVAIFVSHLEYHCEEDRALQTAFVAHRILSVQKAGTPLIVLADFNLQPHTPEMRTVFATGVRDATIQAGTNTTTEVVVGEGHVDYILYHNLQLMHADVLEEHHNVSDHRPVLASFTLLDSPCRSTYQMFIDHCNVNDIDGNLDHIRTQEQRDGAAGWCTAVDLCCS